MLYDPKWEQQTKPSLAGLIAWLEHQPAQGEYCWISPTACLLGQWLQTYGLKGRTLAAVSLGFTDIVGGPWRRIVFDHPYTFGAALERARKYISQ